MTRRSGTLRRGMPGGGVTATADRRFRRSEVRLRRPRSWRTVVRRIALFGAAFGALILFVIWAATSVMDAAAFRIDRIVVQGNRRLSTAEVQALAGGVTGQSIFRVNLDECRSRVLDSPWVAQVVLRRVFPSTIELGVIERAPLVIARLNGQLYLIDQAGVIIDSAGPQYREYDLPVVDGLWEGGRGGTNVDPAKIQVVERLVQDVAGREDLARRLSQIDIIDSRDAVVLIEGEPAKLHLGDRKFLERLLRYEEAASSVREQLGPIDYYDLRFDRLFVGQAGRVLEAGGSTAK